MKKRAKMRIDCRGRVVPVVGNRETEQMEADGMRKMMMIKEEEIRDRMAPEAGKSATAQMKDDGMNTMISMVGNTKVERWFDGVAPDSVEGVTLVGYSKSGNLEQALYVLKSGDFCSINNGVGTFVRRQDFPQHVIDEDCPWEFTDAQFKRMKKLMLKIKAENSESGYDALKAASEEQQDGGVMAELFTLFVKEATKANPPDIDAADKCVLKAITEKVDAMEHGERCCRAAHSLYGDFHRYVAKIAGNDQDNKVA